MFWVIIKWGSHSPTVLPPEALPFRHTQLRLQQVAPCMHMSICGHHSIFLDFSADAMQANSCKSVSHRDTSWGCWSVRYIASILTSGELHVGEMNCKLPGWFSNLSGWIQVAKVSLILLRISQPRTTWWSAWTQPRALHLCVQPLKLPKLPGLDFPRSWWKYHQKMQDGVDVCQDFPTPLWLRFGVVDFLENCLSHYWEVAHHNLHRYGSNMFQPPLVADTTTAWGWWALCKNVSCVTATFNLEISLSWDWST